MSRDMKMGMKVHQCTNHVKIHLLLRLAVAEAREEYERFLVRNRPKYIPMKPEQVAKLPPEERQEHENSLKTTKTPKRYALRSRPY